MHSVCWVKYLAQNLYSALTCVCLVSAADVPSEAASLVLGLFKELLFLSQQRSAKKYLLGIYDKDTIIQKHFLILKGIFENRQL